jgi:hypothetical protein
MSPDAPITVHLMDPNHIQDWSESLAEQFNERDVMPPQTIEEYANERWRARTKPGTDIANEILLSFEDMFLDAYSERMRAVSYK